MQHNIELDPLDPRIFIWLNVLNQVRATAPEGICFSILEICDTIASDLDSYINADLTLDNSKSIFFGLSLIQYLNERYAVDKLILFIKKPPHISLKTPTELILILTNKFLKYLTQDNTNQWTTRLATSLYYINKKDFQAAKEVILPLQSDFKSHIKQKKLYLIEALIRSLTKYRYVKSLKENLNFYLNQYANDPFSLYFLVLKNLVNEIQSFHAQKKSNLQMLRNLFKNLSQLGPNIG